MLPLLTITDNETIARDKHVCEQSQTMSILLMTADNEKNCNIAIHDKIANDDRIVNNGNNHKQ